ncbi:MAG: thioredoxin family protein [Deltaproteobacteria bacterium]|nr:thioredoxin family protein [Deltaproteobacteria bacterium]
MGHRDPMPFFRWICALTLFLLPAGIASGSRATTVEARYPVLEFGILGQAAPAPLDENTLLAAEGFRITRADLAASLESKDPAMRAQLEKHLLFVLDQLATRKLLLAEAQKTGIPGGGKDGDQVIGELLERKSANASVSEDEVNTFYRENRELTGGVPFEQVRDSIRQYLLQEKKSRFAVSYVSSLGKSARLRVKESWLEQQARIALDNPVDKARSSGKPTLVEFGATGCIPCDKMQPILDNLRKNYPGKLNVVFVHVRKEAILATRYGIRSIPIQAFFDSKGKEVFRHVGFFTEDEVVEQLSRMGIAR